MKISIYWKDPDEESPKIPKGKHGVSVTVLLRDPVDNSLAVDQIIYTDQGFMALYLGKSKSTWLPEVLEIVYWSYTLDIVNTFKRELFI